MAGRHYHANSWLFTQAGAKSHCRTHTLMMIAWQGIFWRASLYKDICRAKGYMEPPNNFCQALAFGGGGGGCSLNDGDCEEGSGLAALVVELGHVDAGIIGVGLQPQGFIVPVLHLVAMLHGAWQGCPDRFRTLGSCLLQLLLAPCTAVHCLGASKPAQ